MHNLSFWSFVATRIHLWWLLGCSWVSEKWGVCNPWPFSEILVHHLASRTSDRSWPEIRIHLHFFPWHLPWQNVSFFFFFPVPPCLLGNTLFNSRNIRSIVSAIFISFWCIPWEASKLHAELFRFPQKTCYHANWLCYECKTRVDLISFKFIFSSIYNFIAYNV